MNQNIVHLLNAKPSPFHSVYFWSFHVLMAVSIVSLLFFQLFSINVVHAAMMILFQVTTMLLQFSFWKKSEFLRKKDLEELLLKMDASWDVVREMASTDEEVDALYQVYTKVHFQSPESIAPLLQRGTDEKGPSWGKEESPLLANTKRRDAIATSSNYDGLDGPLQRGEKIVEEANQKYAEEAQVRWEEAEKNDPDLIEAGVERLGDLLRTDWFEKNSEEGAVSRLMKNKQSDMPE
ncbi:MAG: hypothetical protein VW230_03320 [Candidatus Poseidoniales archaeon]